MKKFLLTLLLVPSLVLGQPGPISQVIQDEGVTQGAYSMLNCVGAGVTCALSGSTASITVPTPTPVSTPSLQAVTNVGKTTTNDITINFVPTGTGQQSLSANSTYASATGLGSLFAQRYLLTSSGGAAVTNLIGTTGAVQLVGGSGTTVIGAAAGIVNASGGGTYGDGWLLSAGGSTAYNFSGNWTNFDGLHFLMPGVTGAGSIGTMTALRVPDFTAAANNYPILLENAAGVFFRDGANKIHSSVSNQLDFTSPAFQFNTGNILLPASNQSTQWGASGTRGGIYHDGTHFIIDPDAGGGDDDLYIGATGDDDMVIDKIGLGTSPTTNLFWINFVRTTNQGRGALNFDYNYTGAGVQANILSYPTYSGTAVSPLNLAFQGRVRDNSDHAGTGTYANIDAQFGTSATTTITQGTKNFYGVRVQANQGVGTANTGGAIKQYGIYVAGFPAYTGVASQLEYGGLFEEDVGVIAGIRYGYDDTFAAKGTTYTYYDAGSGELRTFVGGTQVIALGNATFGVFGAVPAAQYTPTGVVSMPVGGGTNPVYDDSQFDGGLGGTSYTLDDIVAAFILYGFLRP